nr:hypothetical protein [Clostridiales bacterium]
MSEKKNQTDGISGAKRFWRLQGACAYRALTPYLMYLVMGILMLACQFISNAAAKYVLSIICIIGGMLYNV